MPSLFYLKILKALAYTKTIFQIGIFNTPQPSGGLLQPFPVSTKDNSSRKKTKGQVERPGKYQHIWHIAFISMYHTLRIMYTFCAHTPIVHILCTHTNCAHFVQTHIVQLQAKKRNFWHGAGSTGPVGGRYCYLSSC